MPEDLTATAAGNSAARQAAAGAAIAADPTGALQRFHDVVGASVFSSNVSADKVVVFEECGVLLDARAIATHLAGGDPAVGEAGLASDQETWWPRRQGFEDLWEHGRRLVYGAVNAGGMGTEGQFGPFCLVVDDPEQTRPDALGVFPGNSAQWYASPAGVVEEDLAMAEATSWADRGALGILERSAEALGAGEDRWPAVICRCDHYLEVARAGNWPVGSVSAIRVRAEFRDELDDLLARDRAREVLSVLDENALTAYRVLLSWRDNHGASIEAIP